MTQPSAKEDASNERFRDLADVLLLRDLVEDLAAVRAACVEVFAFRGTHEWPPALEPPAFWEDLYAELAAGLELAEKTLEEAVREAQAFIQAIDAAGTRVSGRRRARIGPGPTAAPLPAPRLPGVGDRETLAETAERNRPIIQCFPGFAPLAFRSP
jgi:hypothetical protein